MRFFPLLLLSAVLLVSTASANLYSARQVVTNNQNTELPGGVSDIFNADDGEPILAPPMMHFDHQFYLAAPCPASADGGCPVLSGTNETGVDGSFWEIGTEGISPNVAWTSAANFDRWSIIYGGWDTEDGSVSSNFMFFDRQSRTWWDRTEEPGNSPGPLFHHCSVVEGHHLYLLGGCIDEDCNTFDRTSANYAVYWIDLRDLASGWQMNPMNFTDASDGFSSWNGPHPLAGRMGFSCFIADSNANGNDYGAEGGVAFLGGVTNAALVDADFQLQLQYGWFLDLPNIVLQAKGNPAPAATPADWFDFDDEDMFNTSGFSRSSGNIWDDFVDTEYTPQYWITNLVSYDMSMLDEDVDPGYMIWGGYVCVEDNTDPYIDPPQNGDWNSTYCVQMPTNDFVHFTWDYTGSPQDGWVFVFSRTDLNGDFDNLKTNQNRPTFPMAREGESVWEYDGVVFRTQGGIGYPIANKTIADYEEFQGPLLFPTSIEGDLYWDYDAHCQIDYLQYCADDTNPCPTTDPTFRTFDHGDVYFNFLGKIEDDVTLYEADELWIRWPVHHGDGYRADI